MAARLTHGTWNVKLSPARRPSSSGPTGRDLGIRALRGAVAVWAKATQAGSSGTTEVLFGRRHAGAVTAGSTRSCKRSASDRLPRRCHAVPSQSCDQSPLACSPHFCGTRRNAATPLERLITRRSQVQILPCIRTPGRVSAHTPALCPYAPCCAARARSHLGACLSDLVRKFAHVFSVRTQWPSAESRREFGLCADDCVSSGASVLRTPMQTLGFPGEARSQTLT